MAEFKESLRRGSTETEQSFSHSYSELPEFLKAHKFLIIRVFCCESLLDVANVSRCRTTQFGQDQGNVGLRELQELCIL